MLPESQSPHEQDPSEMWRRLLDPSIDDPDTINMREAIQEAGKLRHNDQVLLDDEGKVVATRFDYEVFGRRGSYYAFLEGYDENGLPIVKPTVDDVLESDRDAVYPLRWEQVNNSSVVTIEYMGVVVDVDTRLLILPDDYGSGTFGDNHQLRQLAIEQGVFRPFPSGENK